MRTIITFLLFSLAVFAVSLRPEELKVVYTYNFLKNIQWPKGSISKQYNLLVLSDSNLLKENFILLAKKREIDSKPIIIDFEAKLPFTSYHAIFIDRQRLSYYRDIYKEIEGSATLLISDTYPDQQAIMINLIQKKDAQLSFEIHRANILNQSLGISDEMILLGGTEIDVAQLYKKTRQSLQDEERRSQKLMQEIEISKQEAEYLSKRIEQQNRTIEAKNNEIITSSHDLSQIKDQLQQQQERVVLQNTIIAEQSIQINNKSDLISALQIHIVSAQSKLDAVSQEISKKNSILELQQQRLNSLDQTTATKDAEINQQNQILQDLQQRITSHQNDLLIKEETISNQKNIILLLLVFLSIIAVLIFFLMKLIREKKYHAERDFLTGLYNRRYFSAEAKKLHAKGVKYAHPITIAMIDIDHFKTINDTYGHDIGDEALITIASLLHQKLQKKALIARWGGEEFIALTSIPEDEVHKLFESLKKEIEQTLFTPIDKPPFHLTISIGLHVINDNDSLEKMIKEADALLYAAKIQGRNRIIYNN